MLDIALSFFYFLLFFYLAEIFIIWICWAQHLIIFRFCAWSCLIFLELFLIFLFLSEIFIICICWAQHLIIFRFHAWSRLIFLDFFLFFFISFWNLFIWICWAQHLIIFRFHAWSRLKSTEAASKVTEYLMLSILTALNSHLISFLVSWFRYFWISCAINLENNPLVCTQLPQWLKFETFNNFRDPSSLYINRL